MQSRSLAQLDDYHIYNVMSGEVTSGLVAHDSRLSASTLKSPSQMDGIEVL